MTGLPLCRVDALAPASRETRWLVESLWTDQAVGILGGEPKSCKSWLALDLALAVASGTPALRRFPVHHPGRVLLFCAEDDPTAVQRRLQGIAAAAGVPLQGLELYLITQPELRLDSVSHQRALRETIEATKPRLLVLDPFVRLHRIDENVAREVAPLLALLRDLQRRHHTAVLLVHHARKSAGHARAGQALRGSSELHAWGDSNLYLRRRADRLVLHVEHRAAAAPGDLGLELRAQGDALALAPTDERADLADDTDPEQPTCADPTERILRALAQANRPLTRQALRDVCRMRTHTLGEILRELTAAGRIHADPNGYALLRR
jgi:hypothetical protein